GILRAGNAAGARRDASRRGCAYPQAFLEVEETTLQGDRHRVRPVPGTKLGQDVADVSLDGVLADRQSIRDDLVGAARTDQLQHFDLALRERIVHRVLRELRGDFRRQAALSRV